MQLQRVALQRVTGGFALIDSLRRHGVKHIFGYPGGAILPIYDELYKAEAIGGIQHILVRHEQGAAHAADGYARATGKWACALPRQAPVRLTLSLALPLPTWIRFRLWSSLGRCLDPRSAVMPFKRPIFTALRCRSSNIPTWCVIPETWGALSPRPSISPAQADRGRC